MKEGVPASYDSMEVAEGLTASGLLEKLLLNPESLSGEDRDRICTSLRRYCELDTLAMVRLHERLLEMVAA